MRMKSAEERREALRKRVKDNIKNKDKGYPSGKNILDLSDCPDAPFYKEDEFGIETSVKGTYECQIDVIPFIVSSKNHPDMQIGDVDYVLVVFIHRDVDQMHSTYLCLNATYGLPCPICEERQRLVDQGHSWKDDVVAGLRPIKRAIYNVIDLNDPDEKIRIFSASHANFEAEMVKKVELSPEEMQTFPDLETGKTVKYLATAKKFGKANFFEYSYFEFLDREPYPEDILQETYPLDALLNFPKNEEGNPIDIRKEWKVYYDEVQRAFLQLTDGEEQKGEEQETEPERSKKEETPTQPSEPVRGRWRSRSEQPKEKPSQEKQDDSESHRQRSHMKSIKEEEPKSPPKTQSEETIKTCYYKHTYGTDCDKFPDDCAECDDWSPCSDEQERLKKEKQSEQKQQSAPVGRTRTRTRRGS